MRTAHTSCAPSFDLVDRGPLWKSSGYPLRVGSYWVVHSGHHHPQSRWLKHQFGVLVLGESSSLPSLLLGFHQQCRHLGWSGWKQLVKEGEGEAAWLRTCGVATWPLAGPTIQNSWTNLLRSCTQLLIILSKMQQLKSHRFIGMNLVIPTKLVKLAQFSKILNYLTHLWKIYSLGFFLMWRGEIAVLFVGKTKPFKASAAGHDSSLCYRSVSFIDCFLALRPLTFCYQLHGDVHLLRGARSLISGPHKEACFSPYTFSFWFIHNSLSWWKARLSERILLAYEKLRTQCGWSTSEQIGLSSHRVYCCTSLIININMI